MKNTLRMTDQRMVILELLGKAEKHHTAYSLHKLVKQKLPRVTLATVYRNLETLAEVGEIKKLEISGHKKYFDSILDPHDHIFCNSCHRVDHIEIEEKLSLPDEHNSGYLISARMYFGVCPECRLKNGE